MPINLVMTFCAKLVNQVIQSGTRQGLQPCFEQQKGLGWLADPKTINPIATNYPQFNECTLAGNPGEQQQALESILADPAFGDRFGDSSESFRQMFENGGTDYFFAQLRRQAESSRRKEILSERLSKATGELHEVVQKALPGESGAHEERNRAIDNWVKTIQQKVRQPWSEEDIVDPITRLSAGLRSFLKISPEELDDIPVKAIASRTPIRSFVERQVRNWQSRRGEWQNLDRIGIPDGTEAQKLLGYLIEAADLAMVEQFFKDELGELTSRSDCKQARRYLAHALSKGLLNGTVDRKLHRDLQDAGTLMERFSVAEEQQDSTPESSPHFVAVIGPFLRTLESIKSMKTDDRPDQPGDSEIVAISKMP
jgi:hypothetical protein